MALSDKEIGERIKSVREACDLTQNKFSARLHMTQQTLSRYENGKNTVPYDILEQIAQEFNISLNYFLGVDSKGFSDDELLLLEFYRQSNEKIRKRIFELVKALSDEFGEKE